MREPEPLRLTTVDGLGAEDEARGDRAPAEPREALRAAGGGQQAECQLRQADPHFARDDAQIAGKRQLEPAPHRGPADLGKRHARQRLDAREEALVAADRLG